MSASSVLFFFFFFTAVGLDFASGLATCLDSCTSVSRRTGHGSLHCPFGGCRFGVDCHAFAFGLCLGSTRGSGTTLAPTTPLGDGCHSHSRRVHPTPHYPSQKNHETSGRRSRNRRPGRPQHQQQEGHKWPHHTTTTRRRGVPPRRRRPPTTTRLAKKLRSWRDHRNGSFPQFPTVFPQPSGDNAEDVDLGSVEPRRFLLPHGPQPVGGEESVNEYSPPKKTTNHHGVFLYCDCGDESSLSSNDGPSIRVLEQPSPCWNNHDDDEMDLTTKPGVVLQLSPSGGLAAMPLPASPPRPPHDKETARMWEESERNNETIDDTPSTVSLSSSRRSAEQQQTMIILLLLLLLLSLMLFLQNLPYAQASQRFFHHRVEFGTGPHAGPVTIYRA